MTRRSCRRFDPGPIKEKHPSEIIREDRQRMMETAAREGWGELRSTQVIDGVIIYHFDNSVVRYPLPSGSEY